MKLGEFEPTVINKILTKYFHVDYFDFSILGFVSKEYLQTSQESVKQAVKVKRAGGQSV